MYEEFYGLTGRPFQLTPDPAFFFESTTHRKALSYLGYGLNQGEGFIIITGEVGAGKSTLVAHLMQKIDRKLQTAAQVVTSALNGEELVHVVARQFGLDVEGHDKATALGETERFLQSEARAGRRCLLIVDECQSLDHTALEELRMLSNFQLGSYPLLQCLLLGQPEFRKSVAQDAELEQLRQRIIASHHLEPLGEDEIADYVTHRLKQVGWNGYPKIDGSVLDALYGKANGIPRKVNQIMNRMLLVGASAGAEELTLDMLANVCAQLSAELEGGVEEEPFQEAAPQYEEQEQAADAESVLESEPLELCDEIELSEEYEDAGEQVRDGSYTGPERRENPPPVGVAAGEVAAMLAARDARASELEAAIKELQAAGRTSLNGDVDPKLHEAIMRIEKRLEEQEQSLRHVLSMLIEWLEEDMKRQAA